MAAPCASPLCYRGWHSVTAQWPPCLRQPTPRGAGWTGLLGPLPRSLGPLLGIYAAGVHMAAPCVLPVYGCCWYGGGMKGVKPPGCVLLYPLHRGALGRRAVHG